ncbi:MAG: ExbD/TolR family protein [Helicobacteraceae bacterium]
MYNFDEEPTLNITPLVDVMLVLIAILMLTTPVILYEESIQLPRGSKSKHSVKESSVDIRITKNREVFLRGEKYTIMEFPDSFRVFSATVKKDTRILIKADQRLSYKDVMFVLKSVKDAKFTKISLATDG